MNPKSHTAINLAGALLATSAAAAAKGGSGTTDVLMQSPRGLVGALKPGRA